MIKLKQFTIDENHIICGFVFIDPPVGGAGSQGLQGIQGLPGNDGVQGLPGNNGAPGNNGTQGIQGVPGADGVPGIVRSINSVSVDTVAGATALTDYVYLVTGTHTVTMPTAVGNSNLYTIKNVGIGTVTIHFNGVQTADGSTTITLSKYQSVDLVSDNTNWSIT